MFKEALKRNNGITLIALVVTIIVLLILAGISISIVTFIIVIIREVLKKYRFTKNKSLKIS